MEDTTTPVDGVASDEALTNAPPVAQPTSPNGTEETTEAVDDSQATDQPSAPAAEEAQATEEELNKFAKDKGYDPQNLTDGERKALNMARNAEKKMHESTQKPAVEPPEEVPLTGNDSMDEVIARQNLTDLKLYVRDWFDAHPEAKDIRTELREISEVRPWLSNMDDVYAHFLASPEGQAKIKKEGGRQALTDLAQKQQAIPPSAGATDSSTYESGAITPENVDELVAKNNDAWYDAHRDEIRQAAYGNTRS